MSDNIIQLNEDLIKHNLRSFVRRSVEETLNALLDHEAEELVNAAGTGNVQLRKFSSNCILQVYPCVVWRISPKHSGALKASSGIISNLSKKAYEHIESWRTRPLSGEYPYLYVDGVYLKRSWGGEIQNVSVLATIGVNRDGCREIIGAAEGMKEDRQSWRSFFVWLKERGLQGVRLIIGDKCLGMLETIPEVFPTAKYQRCTVHFYRNIFSTTPRKYMKEVSMMLKAIHAQENKASAREIKRHTKAFGAFPDGQSALMLVCARLRHVADTQWGA